MQNYFNTETVWIALVILVVVATCSWLLTQPGRLATEINNEANLLATRLSKKRKWYLSLPVLYKTREEINGLPVSTQMSLGSCELGTWVKYPKDDDFPDYIILGQVVDSCEALDSQAGAHAMSLPTAPGSGVRFTNHYRIRITTG